MWHLVSHQGTHALNIRLQGARMIAYHLKSKISSSIKAEKALNWFSSEKTIPLSTSVKRVVHFHEPWNHEGLYKSHIFVYQCFFFLSQTVMTSYGKCFSPFRYSYVSAFFCVLWTKCQKLAALDEQDIANVSFLKLVKNTENKFSIKRKN